MENYIAFMAHIPKTEWKQVAKHIAAKYTDYLVVGEHKPYEHLHYLVKMTDDQYRNYANSVFRQKYKLRGRAQDGKARQYGKIKEIRDLERLKAYMVKDGIEYNVNVFTSMNKTQLEKLHKEVSYEKQEREPHKKFIQHIRTNDISQMKGFGNINKNVITIEHLAKAWLKVTNTRLPKRDSLLYYAYQADLLSEDEYISLIYYNKHEHFEKRTL